MQTNSKPVKRCYTSLKVMMLSLRSKWLKQSAIFSNVAIWATRILTIQSLSEISSTAKILTPTWKDLSSGLTKICSAIALGATDTLPTPPMVTHCSLSLSEETENVLTKIQPLWARIQKDTKFKELLGH